MTAAQKEICVKWVEAHANKWQLLNRGKWTYKFHEKTLVRYIAEVTVREDLMEPLLEYLASDDCRQTLSLYDQKLDPAWTPIRAWYEISNKAAGNVAGIRLYHALTQQPEGEADGPYLVEDGCAYKVSMTYYWKVATPPAVPASTSGISYRLSFQRDTETGLYNCVIEKRERVQQDIPEYLMKTTQFEDVGEEVHLGVRGDLDAGGKHASVGNGKTVTRKVTKNQDCTHDVHNTITQDKRVPEAEVTVRVGLRGTTVTTTNRNMSGPASTEGLEVGESVRNQKTDSQLWNQTISRHLRDVIAWLRESCRKTIFGHSHSKTTCVAEDPGFTHVEEAGDGVVHSLSVQKTEDGYDVTEAEDIETPVQNASESIHVGIDGTTRSVTHRNQPTPAAAPTEVGQTVTNEKTPGNRWNQVLRFVSHVAFRRIADACSKTIFAHSHSKTTVQKADPGFSHVEEAGEGKVRRQTVTRTEGGFRIEEGETDELPVRDASVSKRMTLNGLSVQRLHRNQPEPMEDPTEVGKGVVNRKTDGGRYDITETDEAAAPAGKTSESCARDRFTHHHHVTRNEAEPQEVETEFTPGKIVRKTAVLTGTGTANNGTDTTTAVPQKDHYTYTRDDGAIVHVVKYRNQPDIPYYPDGAVGLHVNDGINSFDLHDGQITYLTNAPYRNHIGDLKFIKHGVANTFYEVYYSKRHRAWYHRELTVQLHHIQGDAYTDYLSDEMGANVNRTTTGVMLTKLIRRYTDKDGNELAEWKWVQLTVSGPSANNWVLCDGSCSHPKKTVTRADVVAAAWSLMGGADQERPDANRESQGVVAALNQLPIAIAAALAGQTVDQRKEQIAMSAPKQEGGTNGK